MKRLGLIFVLAITSLVAVSGCKKTAPNWKSQAFEEKKVKPQSGDIEIPSTLWARVAPPKIKEGDESRPETALEPLKVFLIEKNKGVLKGQNIALSFVAGGGEINLSDFVEPLRGSFYFASEFMPDVENANVKVHFVSRSQIRKIGDDVVGAGCDKYFDLTGAFAGAMKKDGFLVNTSDQRHVSALAGIYLFTSTYDGRLHMASLTVGDSEYRALQCHR